MARKTVLAATKRNFKMVIVDPVMQGGTEVSGKTQWVPIKPATDAAFIMGIMRWIFENDKYNGSYLEAPNEKAAKNLGYNSYSNAAHLVIVDEKHPNNRKFLRAKDLGLGTDDFVVIDKISKVPTVSQNTASAELFFEGEVNGIKVSSSLNLLRQGAYKYTLQEYSDICGIPVRQILEVAQEFTSHGSKVAADSLAGTVAANGLDFAVALFLLPALMGAYNSKGGMAANGPGYAAYTPGPKYNLASFDGIVKAKGVKISREGFRYENTTEYKEKVAKGENPYPSHLPWHSLGMSLDGQALFSAIYKYPYQCKIYVNCAANPVYVTPSFHQDEFMKELKKTSNIPLFISIDIVMGETTAIADYVVPDTSVYEQWAMVPIRAQVNTKMTAVRWPVIKPMTPKGYDQPMSMESFIIDVAKKIGAPGFGANAIKDTQGKYWPIEKREDFYLKAVANMAFDGNPVADISKDDLAIINLTERKEWQNSIKEEEWPKVSYVLARGGRFEPDTNYHNGDLMRYGSAAKLNFYSELLATTRNSISGAHYSGTPVWNEEKLANDQPLESVAPTKEWPFRIASAKAKLRGASMLANCPTLQELGPTNFVEINAFDAKEQNLHDGQRVKVVSLANSAEATLRVRQGVARGTAGIHFGYGKWEYGSKGYQIDGKEIKGDEARSTGIASNPLGLVDKTAGVTMSLAESSTGTHCRNGIRVRIEPL